MNFTANAPDSTLSPTGDYSFGLSDRGDQFFLRASTDPMLSQFSFGTAVRNSDGSMSYVTRGSADSGSFDTANNTITVALSLSQLDQFVSHGPTVRPGSTLVGLRGQAFTSNVNGKRDLTRGGTQYTVGCGAADLAIQKTDSPDPAHVGQNLTYTITVTNIGPSSATGVSITDNLPRNAGYASASAGCTAKPSKSLVTCDLGTMASGSTRTVTITVKPTRKGTITNTASVSASSPPDPNTANNTATATTTVVP
jgi:uncharacterized repeat protein (TIGR01451 family)